MLLFVKSGKMFKLPDSKQKHIEKSQGARRMGVKDGERMKRKIQINCSHILVSVDGFANSPKRKAKF